MSVVWKVLPAAPTLAQAGHCTQDTGSGDTWPTWSSQLDLFSASEIILDLVSRHNSIHILVLLSSNVQSSLLSRREREGTVWVLLCVGLLAAGGI